MSAELVTAALAEREAVIEAGLKSFVEVGEALLAIRDGRLYRRSYATFEMYCQERWGFNRHRAAQLIGAVTVVTDVTTAGLPAPSNEAQARELSRVPVERRTEVWRETVERTGGQPTAAAIREVAAPDVTEPEPSPGVGDHAAEVSTRPDPGGVPAPASGDRGGRGAPSSFRVVPSGGDLRSHISRNLTSTPPGRDPEEERIEQANTHVARSVTALLRFTEPVVSWIAEPYSGGVFVEGLEEFLLDDDREGCGDRLNRQSYTWWCTRLPHAAGRHLATGGGLRVFAAWPGDHEPTVADLTEVPS